LTENCVKRMIHVLRN